MGTAVSFILLVSILVSFLVALPLLFLSLIHVGRTKWVCPRCGRKNVRRICRKCGFDKGSVLKSQIRFIGEWGPGSVAFVLTTPIFILGLLLAWTYERTNNLAGCVMAHSMNNLLAVFTTLLR